jgi:hypothetical protein
VMSIASRVYKHVHTYIYNFEKICAMQHYNIDIIPNCAGGSCKDILYKVRFEMLLTFKSYNCDT